MKLVAPDEAYYLSYTGAIAEYRAHGVDTYAFMDMEKRALFEGFANSKAGKNLPEGYVPATWLWLVEGNDFIGEVSIRHHLNDALARYGGHIGYGVRFSRWGKGFGTTMLALALGHVKTALGLDKVLLTCNDDNPGSARVIEKNGGVLQDKIINSIDGAERLTRRYWITL